MRMKTVRQMYLDFVLPSSPTKQDLPQNFLTLLVSVQA